MIHHIQAVNTAILRRGKASKEELNSFRVLAAQARDARNAARDALEKHKHEHGC
jgi:hypothetical protein